MTAVAVLILAGRRDAARDAAERTRDERDQAEKLTWWTDVAGTTTDEPTRQFTNADVERSFGAHKEMRGMSNTMARIVILNGSADCLYLASVRRSDVSGYLAYRDDDEDPDPFIDLQVGVLPPGPSYFEVPIPIPPTPTAGFRRANYAAFNQYVDWVEFRDRKGADWRRYEDGRLERAPLGYQPVTGTPGSI